MPLHQNHCPTPPLTGVLQARESSKGCNLDLVWSVRTSVVDHQLPSMGRGASTLHASTHLPPILSPLLSPVLPSRRRGKGRRGRGEGEGEKGMGKQEEGEGKEGKEIGTREGEVENSHIQNLHSRSQQVFSHAPPHPSSNNESAIISRLLKGHAIHRMSLSTHPPRPNFPPILQNRQSLGYYSGLTQQTTNPHGQGLRVPQIADNAATPLT